MTFPSTSSVLRSCCLALLAVALSACMKIDITQTIDRTGKARISALYDFSMLASLAASGQLGGEEDEIPNPLFKSDSSSSDASIMIDCEKFKEEQQQEDQQMQLMNQQCKDKAPNVILVTGDQRLRRPAFTVRRSGRKRIYLYRLENIDQFTQTSEQNVQQKQLEDPVAEEFGKQFANAIFQGTFTIVMPGKITRSPGGIVNGNSVRFNLTDFPLKKKSVIQSEE